MTPPIRALDPTITLDHGEVAVHFDQTYDTDQAGLWDALTEPERVARWFAPIDGDLRPGGQFRIHFDDGDIPRARITSCEPPTRFSFEWPMSSGPTLVSAEIRVSGAASRLLLTHARLPLRTAAGHAAGWDTYLRTLADFFAGRAPRDWWSGFEGVRATYADRVSALR